MLDASAFFFFFWLFLIVFKIRFCKLFVGATMQENLRFASSGDDIKIWDASSMTLIDKFNPHTSPHGISSMCWSSNSILFLKGGTFLFDIEASTSEVFAYDT